MDDTDFLSMMYGNAATAEPDKEGGDTQPSHALERDAADVTRVRVGPITYRLPSMGYVERIEQQIATVAASRQPESTETEAVLRGHIADLERRLEETSRKVRLGESAMSQVRAALRSSANEIRAIRLDLSNKVSRGT